LTSLGIRAILTASTKEKHMDISQLAAKGSTMDIIVAEIRGKVKFTKLPTAHGSKSNKPYTTGSIKVRGGHAGKVA
jgi:hypothetical protein